jgi:ATP-dependent Clp protease ATP-binding subunit ClpC
VGTEHILLGVLREPEGPAASALAAAGVTHAQVRVAVVRMMGRGVEDSAGGLPFTSAAEHVIERAQSLSSPQPVGSDRILLALLEAQDGAAARILQQLDADPVAIRVALGGA